MKFIFEIQNCIKVEVEADSQEEARMFIIENLDEYKDEMVDSSCCVSDGVEIR